jgi:CheY-like chemotaxis protein
MRGGQDETSQQILVVDDEVAIREVLAEGLEAFGYAPLTAADAAEGRLP